MDHEVLKEMEKALEGNKTLEKLTLNHIVFGTRHNASLSKVDLTFHPKTWDSPNNGR